MGQTLPNGIYLPAEGERNCYDGLEGNWRSLDGLISTVAGKASATHTHGNISNDGKLATANRVLITDGNKVISLSGVTDTELGYLSGVTSAIQTQLNAKAADSDVVHKSGNESIAGNKTFSGGIYSSNYYYGTTAWGLDKANTWSGINTFTAASYGNKIALKNTGLDLSNGNSGLTDTYSHFIRWVDNSDTIYALLQGWTRSLDSVISISNRYKTDANTTVIAELRLENSGTAKAFYSNSNGDTDLGTSAKKWKTLNGVNPGALSLPDYSHPTFLDVTSQGLNWHTDTTPNYYEIPANGYFAVIVQCPNTSNGVLDIFVNNTGIGSSDHGTYAGNELFCCVPVLQGQVVRVRARCDNYYSVAFYPCLGNV